MYLNNNMVFSGILSLTFLISCSTNKNEAEQTISYPQTESQILNEFVGSAPLQYINLDEVPVVHIRLTHIRLTSENMIYESAESNGEEHIVKLSSTLIEKDRLYAFEGHEDKIIQMNMDGEVETVARNGRGPGEVLNVFSMDKNDSTIFVSDVSNARINMYDLEFDPIRSIDGMNAMSIAVNNTYIAHKKMINIGTPTSGLITIAKIDSPKDSVAKVMPKIIPDGFQPGVFNSTNFDMNNQNEIAASYTFLPWLSVFDSTFALERTLIFESSDFSNRKFLPLKVVAGSSSSALGYDSVITNFKYTDEGDLYISDPSLGIIHLKRKPDRSIEAVTIYKIEYPEAEGQFNVGSFEVFEDGTLMGASWYRWFKVNLGE